jgi:hypothetical protein
VPACVRGLANCYARRRAQIVRAIGITIHLNGVMFPSLELLLRHAIQFFSLRGQPHLLEPGEIGHRDYWPSRLAIVPSY